MQKRVWRVVLLLATGTVAILVVLVAMDGIRLHRIHERIEVLELLPVQHAMARVAAIDTSAVRSTNEEAIATHLQNVHDSARNELAVESELLMPELDRLGAEWQIIWGRWVRMWQILAVFVALALVARNRFERAKAAA